jgi:two-component system, NtrC family, response regulator AtoC
MADAPRDPSTTYRLVELSQATIEALRKRAERRLSLVVYHTDGVETALLSPGAPLVVGRRAPSDLAVADGSLSRTHARFTPQEDGHVLVEDLSSTNGVWVGGKRVPSARVRPGEDIVLGNVLACLRVLDAGGPAERPVHLVSTAADRAPIAVSPAMRAALELAGRVAAASVPVILQGETGTGKEVLARYLHEHSPRRERPMVCVNCAAIPSQLVESTLFGHEKGAFTGAGQRQKGVFEEADGGTVFLDEIGELPAPAQAALLRVLETRRFSRVGSVKEVSVDVRVVAATHRDLAAMCAEGRFRADLYYRLNTVVVSIPALRDRVEDIEPLAHRFLRDMSAGRSTRLSPEALDLLLSHPFPGNVRELRNAIEHAVVVAAGPTLGPADLPPALQRDAAPGSTLFVSKPPLALGGSAAPPADAALGGSAAPPADAALSGEAPAGGDLRSHLQAYESQILFDTLQATGWNQSEAARRLGMPIRTLAHRIKSLGLKKPER